MYGGRVGEVIRRYIDSLNGSDRAGLGVADPFFKLGQLRGECRLVAQAGGQLTQQAGNLHPRLNETKDVVDHQKHVLLGVVAEILGHCKCRVADPETGTRRFVHLAEDHDGVSQNPAFFHFPVQLLAFAAPLADATEDTHPFMAAHRVMDHLGDEDGLADTGASEQAGLAAALQRCQHVDGLDAGFKNFRDRRLISEGDRLAMNRAHLTAFDISFFVNGIAEDVEHPPKEFFAHRHLERLACIGDCRAAREPLCGRQGDSSYRVGVDLCKYFDNVFAFFSRHKNVTDGRRHRKVDVNYTAADG